MKLFICPYFGELPPWMEHYWANAERLRRCGYNFLLDDDEDGFRQRVRSKLGVECPPMSGTGKIWDFRPALGLLYAEEARGYEFWGHTDFDCVYGRVERWVTDEFLSKIDMHSNCESYVNGCWSLYRNCQAVNSAFYHDPTWQTNMESSTPTGWVETSYSAVLNKLHEQGKLVREWTQWQVFEDLTSLRLEDDRLMDGGTEVMMAHFRRTKRYPPGCRQ